MANGILVKMLERLRAGLLDGPGLNCRPHNSRQRVDVKQFEKLGAISSAVLLDLLGPEKRASVQVKLAPKDRSRNTCAEPASKQDDEPTASAPENLGAKFANGDGLSSHGDTSASPNPQENRADRFKRLAPNDPLAQQQALLRKLRILTEDARVYEQDTGVHTLNIGFPMLCLPPDKGRGGSSSRRILAPVAFIPVTLNLKTRPRPSIEITCRADEIDRVVPNPSLFAWIEQFGKRPAGEPFEDETGAAPWREIVELTRWVASAFAVPLPEMFTCLEMPQDFQLDAAPKSDNAEPTIISAAVLGLFPVNNQALLRDMEAMAADDSLTGPIRSFIDVEATLDATPYEYAPAETEEAMPTEPTTVQSAGSERLVSMADPCQARAVRLARESSGLVVHGPPGTGKSQTITNVVGDHLARGERVLVVCDKRTALDVVADRLVHLGLGSLVAVVHDPSRDQRELYRCVRDQLENLTDTRTEAKADRDLARLDRELDAIHEELANAHRLLHQSEGADTASFHELVGQWLALKLHEEAQVTYHHIARRGVDMARVDVETHGRDLRDLLQKAEAIEFGSNPWSQCAGSTLDDFLTRAGEEIRGSLRKCMETALQADAAGHSDIPSFRADLPLSDQVAARTRLAELIHGLLGKSDQTVIDHWSTVDSDSRAQARRRLDQAAIVEQDFRMGPLDLELWHQWGQSLPSTGELARQIGDLERYLNVATKWYGVVCWVQLARANRVLRGYGLPSGRPASERLFLFLKGCQARRLLRALLQSLAGNEPTDNDRLLNDDLGLSAALNTHHRVLDSLCCSDEEECLEPLRGVVGLALRERNKMESLLDGLRKSPVRANQIEQLDAELQQAQLFHPSWLSRIHQQLCQGKHAAAALEQLLESLPALEVVLRVLEGVQKLPNSLSDATAELLRRSIGAEQSLMVLEKLSLEHAIRGRLAACPELQRLDGQRLSHSIGRYREIRGAKHRAVCASILHRWTELQKQRLLASTRSRLNSEGADVRRRLTIQGDRALRLRKVIEIGASIEGGDPLFDLRPVWMASPETVAQIFPRLPFFDVIVFDEASQCRLEEALPVLTRGRRVVVAGDTKQLPPTRFFESAAVISDEDVAETEQEWFELQQGEVEDLLAASLNLQIEQCYLDVHYRSRNADLISFSNEQFYASRLQPIPGHPSNRVRFAPITLYSANGVYDDRMNRIEAKAVCNIVHDLLRRADPPSIGIACFNTDQCDLIVDCLDELAEEDSDFAERLAEARSRKGEASSEGLFVKNLENVQGDERDHIIISTTYGPDPKGRFYRRFGPLGRAGGGRRLNVLVTRARHEIHLVSSIPAAVYRAVPPLQAGQTPNGAWLLFSYLSFAERLTQHYAQANDVLDEQDRQDQANAGSLLPVSVEVNSNIAPSLFAEGLADILAREQRIRSEVHWGNDGFCIDIALGHPRYLEDVTLGLLCDMNRYPRADDPVEWEIFRTEVLEATGWQLHRVWTPQFFRDPASVAQGITCNVDQFLAQAETKNALRVAPK